MATHEKPADRGTRRGRDVCANLGRELRAVRTGKGLSQAEVGRAVALSGMQISRIERAMAPSLSIYHACRIAAVLGLELSVKAYPVGTSVRDAGQLALLDRLFATLPSIGPWTRELPLPLPNDLRAWDTAVQLRTGLVAFDAETHLSDLQALQRREALKLRDDPRVKALILVVADSRHNRRVLADHREALAADFPLGSSVLLQTLAAGLVPPANGILVM